MQKNQCTGQSEFFNQLSKEKKKISCPLEVSNTAIGVYNKKRLAKFYNHSMKSSANLILKLIPLHFTTEISETCSTSVNHLSPQALTALVLHSEILTNELGSSHITGPIMKHLYDFFHSKGFIVTLNAFNEEPNSKTLSPEEMNNSGLMSGLYPTLLSINLDIPSISHSDTRFEKFEIKKGYTEF